MSDVDKSHRLVVNELKNYSDALHKTILFLPLFFVGFVANCAPATTIEDAGTGTSEDAGELQFDAGSAEIVIDTTTHLVQATYNGVTSTVAVRIPSSTTPLDTLLIFHGTTMDDEVSITAAEAIIERADTARTSEMAYISVAFREAGVLMGDDLIEAEAMLLRLQERAEQELGFEIGRLYLFGHSRGGYLVTQLNTCMLPKESSQMDRAPST
ncbi:MAG: hypothetical protein GY822_09550 [Deltaproteobacteria bacterium]|nr:hypothetical protein [Deltaproteobacteria bacterium]